MRHPSLFLLVNGAQPKNVYWQVGSLATINGAGGGNISGTILAKSGATISTPGNATATILNGRVLGLFGSVTMVNAVVNAPGSPVLVMPARITASPIVLSGSHAADVTAVPGHGFLNINNNGGHVSATEVGTGTIVIFNDGGTLTATNTGNGTMTIHSTSTGAVTVTNTGKGNVSVMATGTEAITLTHDGDEDFSYPTTTGVLKR